MPIISQEFVHSSQFNARMEELISIEDDLLHLLADHEEGKVDDKEFDFMSDKMAQDYAFAKREKDSLGW